MESLVINKLPTNYKLEDKKIDLVADANQYYVYMYLNKKIWIFKPNSKNFRNTMRILCVFKKRESILMILFCIN
jgi:hypothetical protein